MDIKTSTGCPRTNLSTGCSRTRFRCFEITFHMFRSKTSRTDKVFFFVLFVGLQGNGAELTKPSFRTAKPKPIWLGFDVWKLGHDVAKLLSQNLQPFVGAQRRVVGLRRLRATPRGLRHQVEDCGKQNFQSTSNAPQFVEGWAKQRNEPSKQTKERT